MRGSKWVLPHYQTFGFGFASWIWFLNKRKEMLSIARIVVYFWMFSLTHIPINSKYRSYYCWVWHINPFTATCFIYNHIYMTMYLYVVHTHTCKFLYGAHLIIVHQITDSLLWYHCISGHPSSYNIHVLPLPLFQVKCIYLFMIKGVTANTTPINTVWVSGHVSSNFTLVTWIQDLFSFRNCTC